GSDGTSGVNGDGGPKGDPGDPSPWLTADGVGVQVTALTFGQNTATVAFTLTDGAGVPVDASGRLTSGAVNVGFVLAQLAQNAHASPAQSTAYTPRVQTSPINGASATQATTESSGTLHAVDVTKGMYTYDFAAALTGLDPTLTQTVGAFTTRGTAIARDTF